jgi:IS30 family transposase
MDRFILRPQITKKEVVMSHLTAPQRYTISCMLKEGYTQREIAKAIGKDKSVISRELKRNSDKRSGIYKDDLANRKYAKRQKEKHKYIKFTLAMQRGVEALLREDYSPEQVVGVFKKRNQVIVSTERIYQHIWADKKASGTLYQHLRRQGRRYRKRGASKDTRGIIKNRISIEKRPKMIEKRERFGDLEVDLIIGKNHKQAIVTINDRASGMLKMKKVPSKESQVVQQAITEMLEDWIPYIFTITSDNGKEFADHQTIAEKSYIDYYFAHPYHSWERGSNENLNGLIRQYIPKDTDFKTLTNKYIKNVENKLNNRPRKRYHFETPIFEMEKLLFNPKVAFVN